MNPMERISGLKKCFGSALMLGALLTLGIALAPAQQFPDGEGKDLMLAKCSGCHGVDIVAAHRDTAAGWQDLVDYMISRGMEVTEDEAKTVHKYLSTAFPKDTKGKNETKNKDGKVR